jgi:aminoglycoside phosphotransferase (APT) family kinase protein
MRDAVTTVDEILRTACARVGMESAGHQLIRASENTIVRLPGGVVARISRTGQLAAAAKEVAVSRWLVACGVPVVEVVPDVEQPVAVDGRAVTFWKELPPHRYSTVAELAMVLRHLHSLPSPGFDLPPVEPFVRQRERIAESALLSTADRDWLLGHLSELEERFAALPAGLPWCAVHGDVWAGNVVVADGRPILLDLERFATGPPEWDLTSIAVDYTTFGDLPAEDWAAFVAAYGRDVTAWAGFETLRDARELRKVTFALQMAGQRPELAREAAHRLRCIQGRYGARPWGWTGVA